MKRYQISYKKHLDHESTSFDMFLNLSVLILVSLVTLMCFLIIISYPKPPIVQIKSVQPTHFNITSSSLLTASLNVQFSIENPNKKTNFSIESATAYLIYRTRYSFLSTNINSFNLESSSKVMVNATFEATSVFVNGYVSRDMDEEWKNLRVVSFDVRVYSEAFFESSSSWIWGWQRMWIHCRDVTVRFCSNKSRGTMLHIPRRCKAGLLFRA